MLRINTCNCTNATDTTLTTYDVTRYLYKTKAYAQLNPVWRVGKGSGCFRIDISLHPTVQCYYFLLMGICCRQDTFVPSYFSRSRSRSFLVSFFHQRSTPCIASTSSSPASCSFLVFPKLSNLFPTTHHTMAFRLATIFGFAKQTPKNMFSQSLQHPRCRLDS